jgi:hypothetical protein
MITWVEYLCKGPLIGPGLVGGLNSMLKKFAVCFAMAVIAANAATYHVTLFQDSKVNGKTLKAGDYRVEVKDNAVLIKGDHDAIEAPARTETADKKFATTTVRYNQNSDITDIKLGGTNKHVVVLQDKTNGGS